MTLHVAVGSLSPEGLHAVVLDFQFPVSAGPEGEAYAVCPDVLDHLFEQVIAHIHLIASVAVAVVLS